MTSGRIMMRAVLAQENSPRRRELVEILQRDGDIRVVTSVSTADEAIQQVGVVHPDVLVIDLHLAVGLGLHAIEQIMAETPLPILLLSAPTEGLPSPSAATALLAGALESLTVPARWTRDGEAEFRHGVRRLCAVRVIRHPRGKLTRPVHHQATPASRGPVVAMAASTGGPSALALVLGGLGGLRAPVLVVQHLHPDFTSGLLRWMSQASALPVEIAAHGALAEPGHVYLAHGDLHLRLGPGSRLELTSVPEGLHRPSADQLFLSVAENAGTAGIGVLLTGMGDDGAQGLLAIHGAGGRTIAQDEASSAVFGMPRAAARLGAVRDLLPLDRIASAVCRSVVEVAQ